MDSPTPGLDYGDERTPINDREMLWKIVSILGCGGKNQFVVASDGLQDNDRKVLDLLKSYLVGDTEESGF